MNTKKLSLLSCAALAGLLFAASPGYAADKTSSPPVPPVPVAPVAVPPPLFLPPSSTQLDVKDPVGSWQMTSLPSPGGMLQCSASRNNLPPVFTPPPAPAPNATSGAAPTPPAPPPTPTAPPALQVSFMRMRGVLPPATTPTDTLQIQVNSFALPEKTDYAVAVDGKKIETAVTSRSYNRNLASSVADIKAFMSEAHKGKKVSITLDDSKVEIPADVIDAVLAKLDGCLDQQAKDVKEALAKRDAEEEKAKKK